ncbi:hypothetical protein B4N89_29430 [Embleya scabrispora]|uniref:Toxin-antitoxin system HicB family antitoxin n=1 Tax=Embleya scabrispora TaxID=159449 RepID=A0A1T3P6L1_9ACTN|nr:hypothetical protein [Embleya scabrispora]OPC84500.1 hypothetical protein B4N89_29430 [Embleya scabrispora]
MTERKKILLRLDPAVHDAIAKWAADELRSTNAQIEFLLRRALGDAGRMPGNAGRPARRGRPPKPTPTAGPALDPDNGPETDSDAEPGGGAGGDRGDPGGSGRRRRDRGDGGDLEAAP